MTKKYVGIIGGMGPMATADLFIQVIKNTCALTDQEHLPMLVDVNTNIPDRTSAILAGGASPLPEMIASAKRLEAAGVDLLAIPCNTAHYFRQELCKKTTLPIIDMVEEVANEIGQRGFKRVGLLGTTGLLTVGLYQNALLQQHIETILPSPEGQMEVMKLIYHGVKAGVPTFDITPVQRTINEMERAGAEVFVLACTELPIGFENYHIQANTINPTVVLARTIIRKAGGILV